MKHSIFDKIVSCSWIVLTAVLSAGCVKDSIVEPSEKVVTVLTADVRAKTVLQDDRKVLWTSGDRINVNGIDSAPLELDDPAGAVSFSFDGVLTAPYKAVFPSSIYEDELTVVLPAVQTYKEGTFAETASPMAAYQESGSNLRFGHLCSVMKLNVNVPSGSTHTGIAYIEFRGKNDEQVCGTFEINHKEALLTGASDDVADRKVRYEVTEEMTPGVTSMYVVVPAIQYTKGYTFRLVDVKGHYMEISKGSAHELEPGKVYDMPPFDFVPTGTVMDGSISPAATIRGFVYDSSRKPLSGVVVSDGLNCVQTNRNGAFAIDCDTENVKFVTVSIPSGYSAPVRNGLPIFFKRLSEETKVNGIYNLEFVLDKVPGNAERYSLLIAADPQPRRHGYARDQIAYPSLACCEDLYRDMREQGATIMADKPCYGIVLGDIVHEDMSLFDTYVENGMAMMGFPTFNVLGNHDNDYTASSDAEGARVFEEKLCPANYSFNLGNIHYIILDNLIMEVEKGTLNGSYKQGLSDDIMHWLEADLSFVHKDRTIMVCAHSPMFMNSDGSERSNTATNGKSYAALLSGYKKVYAWAGHVHTMFNYVYDSGSEKSNIEVHTLSRSTGELWTNEYMVGGTPRGYVVVDVEGDDVQWRFHPTRYQSGKRVSYDPDLVYSRRAWNYDRNGVAVMRDGGAVLDDSYQMNVYPRGAYGDDYVYANVFMWDQNWENPVFISDSGSVSEMTLVTESGFMFDIAQKEIFDFYKVQSTTLSGDDSYSWNPNKARHLFRVYSDKKKDGGRVEVIDRFGNVYSAKVSW
jgi:hypothetical protein